MGSITNILSLLSAGAGLLGFSIAVIVAFFAVKNGVMKSANDAQSSTISAMRDEIDTLRGTMENREKEYEARLKKAEEKNAHLEQTIDTICTALKSLGLIVTVQGEIVSIEDKRGRSTNARIRPLKQDDAI